MSITRISVGRAAGGGVDGCGDGACGVWGLSGPAGAGFVCGPGDRESWSERVERVWTAYYRSVEQVAGCARVCGSGGTGCGGGGVGAVSCMVCAASSSWDGRRVGVADGLPAAVGAVVGQGSAGVGSAVAAGGSCGSDGGVESGGDRCAVAGGHVNEVVEGAGCAGGVGVLGDAEEAGPAIGVSGLGVGESLAPVVRGKHWASNRRKRELRKSKASSVPEWRRKPARREDDAVSEESQVLQRSLQEKWTAENRVAKLRADQQFELLKARDLERVKKMQAAQVMRTTEQAKVQTEKAFGFLAKTGNVPGVVGEGFVEGTVLTNATPGLTRSAGDTISPDSSASMHEYRLALKEVADEKKKNADLERALAQLRITAPRETAEAERYAGARTTFTLDTDGEPPVADEGFIGDDGKYHTFQRLTHPDWTPSTEKAMIKQGLDMYYDDY